MQLVPMSPKKGWEVTRIFWICELCDYPKIFCVQHFYEFRDFEENTSAALTKLKNTTIDKIIIKMPKPIDMYVLIMIFESCNFIEAIYILAAVLIYHQ